MREAAGLLQGKCILKKLPNGNLDKRVRVHCSDANSLPSLAFPQFTTGVFQTDYRMFSKVTVVVVMAKCADLGLRSRNIDQNTTYKTV